MTAVGRTPSGPERASAGVRDSIACARDRVSAQRDRLAVVRDRLADAHDDYRARGATPRRGADTFKRTSGREIVFRAARERERCAGDRQAAAEQRIAAALDREHSAHDRQMAALDRASAVDAACRAGPEQRGGASEPIVIRRDVAVHASAVAGARRAVAGLRLPEDVAGTVELAVSELVTNAITHAGITADDLLELLLTRRGNRVRVAVHDRGQGFAVPSSVSPDPSIAHGRGLLIVRALAETWGVESGPTGCTVWCEVVTPAVEPPPEDEPDEGD